MTRNLSGAVLTAIQQQTGERVYLIEVEFSGGTLRWSTGANDLSWNGYTWDAAGGNLSIGQIEETRDTKGGGIDIQISGVDQTVTGVLLSQQYRGRELKVWQVLLNQTSGVIIDVVPIFEGLQLDSYEVDEVVERGKPITCTIKTRGKHRLATAEYNGIMCNVHSHQQFSSGDTFFKHVASFADKEFYWGAVAPRKSGWGHVPNVENDESRRIREVMRRVAGRLFG
jgi:hypothetical protein